MANPTAVEPGSEPGATALSGGTPPRTPAASPSGKGGSGPTPGPPAPTEPTTGPATLGPRPLDVPLAARQTRAAPTPGPVRVISSTPSARDRRRVGRSTTAADRVNRLALTILGLVALVAGIGGLLLSTSALTWSETPSSLYRSAVSSIVASSTLWSAIAVAIAVAALVIGLRWAFVQLKHSSDGPRVGAVRVGEGQRGRTTFPAAAVAKAAGADFGRLPGVTNARVRLLAVRPQARALVSLEIGLDTDAGAVLAETPAALARLATSLDADNIDAEFRLRFGKEMRNSRGVSRVR